MTAATLEVTGYAGADASRLAADLMADPGAMAQMPSRIDRAFAATRSVQAWACHDPQQVRSAYAALADADGAELPLFGVPIGVKDNIDVRGLATRHGSAAYPEVAAPFDAACVAALRRAGAVPVGKTVTTEFAFAAPGPTGNPWNLAYTPGGSSSGSAAAVACGAVPLALGTQTGGSVIRPAAYCGVVGFKPSRGRVDKSGVKTLSASFDTVGWFARSVADAALVASVLLEGRLPAPRAGHYTIGIAPDEALGPIDDALVRLKRDAIDRLRAEGHRCIAVEGLGDLERLSTLHNETMAYEMARSLAGEYDAARDRLRPKTVANIERGLRITTARWYEMLDELAAWQQRGAAVMGHYDAVLSFSAGLPTPGLESAGDSLFNRVWTALDCPALHLPLGYAGDNLPMGLQWTARPHHEFHLLGIAQQLHGLLDCRHGLQQPPWVDRALRTQETE